MDSPDTPGSRSPVLAAVGTRPRPMGVPAASAPLVLPLVMTLIGLGAVSVSMLGPLGLGVLDYHVSSGAADQIRGGDVAGLLLVAPASLFAAWLLRRRHDAGPAVALAPASYGLYMYTQLAISGELAEYDGNSERFFALFWLLIILCGADVVVVGAQILGRPGSLVPPYRPGLVRVVSVYLFCVAAFLAIGLHLPGLVDAWRDAPTSQEYLADPVVFWVVKVMDLAYVLPLLIAVGVALVADRPWALRLMAPLVGSCALMASAVAGMGLTMLAAGAPGASLGLAAGFTVVAIVALVLAVAVYEPLFRRSA